MQTEPTQSGADLMLDGLVSMAVQLSFDTGVEEATVVSTDQASEFSEFQENVIDNDAGVAAFAGAVGFEDQAVTGSSVLLGTFTFTGTTSGDITSVQAKIPSVLTVPGPYLISGAQTPIALDTFIESSSTTICTDVLKIVSVFTDRASFEMAVANTATEDFEESSLASGEVDTTLSVLNSETNGGSFMPGDIEDGLELSVIDGGGSGALGVVRDFEGLETAVVGPDFIVETLLLTFDPGTNSVGFDVRTLFIDAPVTVEVIAVSGRTAQFTDVPGTVNGDSFFAIIAAEEIESISLDAAGRFEFVDNVVFNRFGDVLLGDINLDGIVNLLDVAPFVDLISSGQFQAEGDLNGDGIVNLLDVGPFIVLLGG